MDSLANLLDHLYYTFVFSFFKIYSFPLKTSHLKVLGFSMKSERHEPVIFFKK